MATAIASRPSVSSTEIRLAGAVSDLLLIAQVLHHAGLPLLRQRALDAVRDATGGALSALEDVCCVACREPARPLVVLPGELAVLRCDRCGDPIVWTPGEVQIVDVPRAVA